MSVPGTTGNLFSKGLHSLLEGTLPSLSSALRDSLGRLGSDPEEIALHLESLPERDRTPLTETVKDIGLLTERLQEAEEAAGAALNSPGRPSFPPEERTGTDRFVQYSYCHKEDKTAVRYGEVGADK